MQDKETLVKAHAFSKDSIFRNNKYLSIQESIYLLIKKVLKPNMHNFWKLRLI